VRPFQIALPIVVSVATLPLVGPSVLGSAVPLALRLRGAGTALLEYAQLLVWPAGLHLDRLTPTGGGGAAVAGGLLAVVAMVVTAAFLWRPRLPTLFGVSLLLLYAPGSGFVPVYPQIADHLVFTGEQLMYAPLAALGLGLAGGIAWLTASRPLVPLAASALAVLAWTMPVIVRQTEFFSAERVYRKTLQYSPSPRACFNFGNLQLARRELPAAVTTYQSCLALAPDDAGIHGQLAVALQKLGYAEDSRSEYERSLEIDPSDALVWSNYASLDANAGRYKDARAKWEKALAIDPSDEAARAAIKRLDEKHL
jgi:hypothetical protein